MELGALLDRDSRVIDVGPASAALARELADQGHHRYLGLVEPRRLEAVRADAGPLAERFHPLRSAGQALHCSTDALVVRTRYRDLLWALRDLEHLRHVAIEVGPAEPVTALAAWRARFSSTTRRVGTADGAVRAQVLALPARRRRQPRAYLSPVLGAPGLAARLAGASVHYAVLRWFDELPHVAPDEDLDILVADDDLATLRSVLEEEPGIIPVDVYSESGTGGADFRNAAYYPPPLARGLLERAVVHRSGLLVPAPEDHLRSLAYHAAYHKGFASGVPSGGDGPGPSAVDHDYVGTLAELGRRLAEPVGTTLEEVDAYLGSVGWRPPPDTLRRLAPANPWLAGHLPPTATTPPDPPLVSVFVVREATTTVVALDEVVRLLAHHGFGTLAVHQLGAEARARCTALMRGGNWGLGPFPVSGGGPAAVVVAAHYAPERPSPATLVTYPRLENNETLRAKNAVRDLVASRVAEGNRFNPLHSSDDETEAWEYAQIALEPDEVARLRERVAVLRAQVGPGPGVVEVLNRGRRAKVEVVDVDGTLVVRKTFWPGFAAFRDREAAALSRLAPLIREVPPLLAEDRASLTIPLYRGGAPTDGPGRRLVPLREARHMVDILRRIDAAGYDVIDAKPQNFVRDPDVGLVILDLEFLHEHTGARPDFVDAWAFVGAPDDVDVDHPVGARGYDARWLPYVGMRRATLVAGGPLRQVAERAAYRVHRAMLAPGARPRAVAGRTRARVRALRSRAAWTMTVWGRRRAARLVAGEPA